MMNRIFATAVVLAAMITTGKAEVIDTVVLPGAGTVAGTTFTLTNSLVDAGVTFDVNYTVTGSAALTFDPDGTGLGVAGSTTDGINNGESMTFTATISNVMNGTVVGSFDGVLLDLGLAGTTAAFSGDLGPQVLDAGIGSDFYVDSFTASFTATAVPEPGSFAALGFLGMGMVLRRRRRKTA